MLTPEVGTMLQFWPHATKEAGNLPMAAVVTRRGAEGSGMVKLSIFGEGGGDLLSNGEYVRYIHDPWVEQNRHRLVGGRGTAPRGAWDWIPGWGPSTRGGANEKQSRSTKAKSVTNNA